MKDLDIMRDLGYCANNICINCTREATADCHKQLMKDAVHVMRMQYDALNGFSADMAQLKDENGRLKLLAKMKCTEKELVDAVNDIVHYCLDNDEDEEGNAYINIIHAMLAFGELMPSKHRLVIKPECEAPELKKA